MRLLLALALAMALSPPAWAMAHMDLPAGYPAARSYTHGALIGLSGAIVFMLAEHFLKSARAIRALWWGAAVLILLSVQAYAVDFDGYHPDPKMTPGAVYSTDKRVICANSNASRPREGVESLRPYIFTAYGIPQSDWHLYQLDHLIDRGVGGADSAANLYPQRLDGPRGALVKDHQCDTRAWRMLCKDGSITVAQAQAVFKNWEVECPRVLHGVLPKVP